MNLWTDFNGISGNIDPGTRFLFFFYLFGVLCHFQHCTGHITMGSWKGRGNQYIQFVRVQYCKLPTNGKQLPAFPLKAAMGIEPRPQRWEARVLPLCHRAPPPPPPPAQGTDDKFLLVILVWLQEFKKRFFIIAFISNIVGVVLWRRHAFPEFSCLIHSWACLNTWFVF